MTSAIRDNNHVPVILGQDSTDATNTLPIKINPITGRILVDLTGASSGTVTSVTSADANVTVATPTTTPVITIVSAPKLQTARAIYGNNFDGSAALTQIIASTYGGTGNGFTKFSGPATTEKTFTLPNSNATLARTDAAQTFTGVQTFSSSPIVPAPSSGTDATNKTYVDALVVGLLDDRGSYDASVNTFPASGGSGTAGAVLKGDLWYISIAGTLGSVAVNIGDSVRALTDTPGQTASNWSVLEANIGYVPENIANKSTTLDTDKTSNVKYSTAKSIYDWATGLFQTLANKDATGGYAGLTLFKINFKNAANTFTNFFTNATTAARTYTFPDKDITVAGLVDITGTNSNTNTGDETAARIATINHGTSAKTTLVDADEITGQDSAASFGLIRTTWTNVKVFLKTYNDTLYAALAGSISQTFGALGIELGHATDTTLTRSSAGVLAVEGVIIPSVSSTNTLTNKRITARIGTETSSGTSTPTADSVDQWNITALAAADAIAAPTGTPTDGQSLILRIKDNGTARALTWNAIYRASSDLALPSTTIISKTMYCEFLYNAADSKWDFVGFLNNF